MTSEIRRISSDKTPAVNASAPAESAGIAPHIAKQISVSAAVAILGVVITILGIVMIVGRFKFAALLGARSILEVPVTELDAAKILYVAVSGTVMTAMGVVTVIGGIIAAIFASLKSR
jgi:hypothetical protein